MPSRFVVTFPSDERVTYTDAKIERRRVEAICRLEMGENRANVCKLI